MACNKRKKMACGGRVKKRRKMESGGTVSKTPKPKKKEDVAKTDSVPKKRKFTGLVGIAAMPTPPQLKRKNWDKK